MVVSLTMWGYDSEAYFHSVKLTNAGVLNGTYDGWCADDDTAITTDKQYVGADVYSSYEALPAGLVEKPYNLDLVNWVLNQDFLNKDAGGGLGLYTAGDIQKAIWILIENSSGNPGGRPFSIARANQIVSLAIANGEGFDTSV